MKEFIVVYADKNDIARRLTIDLNNSNVVGATPNGVVITGKIWAPTDLWAQPKGDKEDSGLFLQPIGLVPESKRDQTKGTQVSRDMTNLLPEPPKSGKGWFIGKDSSVPSVLREFGRHLELVYNLRRYVATLQKQNSGATKADGSSASFVEDVLGLGD